MTETKIVLLVGRTGRGKSALANVLANRREIKRENTSKELVKKNIKCHKCEREFVDEKGIKLVVAIIDERETYYYFHEECFNFKESAGSVSETRSIQSERFEENDVKYCIIDTPGIGDTKLPKETILDTIAEAVHLARDGVNQLIFVTDGRFDQYEVSTYDILRKVIFDNDVTNHTTIVRTRFSEFKDEKVCNDDINSMINIGGKLAEIIRTCQKRVIHVDNPSVAVKDDDELNMNKKKRSKSRKKLLDHLNNNCQTIYKPEKLKNLSDEITEYMEKKIKLKEELKKLKILKKRSENELTELVKGFIEASEKAIKDKNDNEAKGKIEELQQILKEKGLSTEKVEKIIQCCERLVNLWKQIEQLNKSELQEKLQSNIEISPLNK